MTDNLVLFIIIAIIIMALGLYNKGYYSGKVQIEVSEIARSLLSIVNQVEWQKSVLFLKL